MGQITKDFAELMVKAAESGHHTPLTPWEQKQFALAWLDRESKTAAGVQGDAARLEQAFDDGWRFCAKWARRDDLAADIGSKPYTEGRSICLAAIASQAGKD